MRSFIPFLLFTLVLLSCVNRSYDVLNNSVIVYPKSNDECGAVKVTILTDEIIKVESSFTEKFDTTASLVALDLTRETDFTVEETDSTVVISTSKLLVCISKTMGTVGCFDKETKLPVVAEKPQGKEFQPVTVEGTNGYAVRQQFVTSDTEALYGLGQHQASEMNYKGKNEELFQYNTKVSVPFIVSTKNYGILWDNYSLTRFGDPRAYGNIDQFTLYAKNGEKGGLTATYVDDKNEDHVFTERIENTIDYENLETIKNFPERFNFSNARITWEGELEPSESGVFRFLCYYAGYTKLWVDGQLMFDKWRTSWNPSVAKFNVDMEKGLRYHVKLERIPDGGRSYIGLKALSPVSEDQQKQLSFSSEMGTDIRYYVMVGNSMDDIISHYRTITGKAQVLPKWAMGFWQSRERYKTQDELLETLSQFRKRHIPIDNIVLDWSYWPQEAWGSHDFDLERFPDAKGMIDQVHEQNARIMVSVWPKFYHTTDHYKAFDENGWMYRRAVEDSVRDWIGKGYIGSFYDAYNPEARKLFWEKIKEKL